MNKLLLPVTFAGLALLAACAAHGGAPSSLPQTQMRNAQNQTAASNVTIKGPIVAIKSSTEFQVQGGSGCGSVDIFTNSSTTFTPAGAKPAVGDNSVNSGTGSCATNLQASSVTLSTPTPGPSASPTPFPASYAIGHGEVFGVDDRFTSTEGDTSSGGQGQTVDGVPCATTMPNTYHVHAFLGIIVNGRQFALQDGIGMVQPGADITYAGIPNWTEYASKCYYYMHTHDASGVIHLESSRSVPLTTSIFTLGNFFHVWGETVSTGNVAQYTGTVRVYLAQVPFRTESIPNTDYKLYTGDPNAIPLYSHTCIWLEVGPNYVDPSKLPILNWWDEY